MSIVVMERVFSEPVSDDELAEMQAKSEPCFDVNAVSRERSFVSLDRKRFVCVFDAPDASAVRRAMESAGLSYERIWGADTI